MAILVVVVFAFVSCNKDKGGDDSSSSDTGSTDTGSTNTGSTDTGSTNTGSGDTNTGSTNTNTNTNTNTCVEHSYEWQITTTPTCRDNGKKENVCTVCGTVSETQTIFADKQYCDFSEHIVEEATCTKGGIDKWVCKVCGDTDPSKQEIKTDPAHKPGEWVEVPATCEAKGYKYQKCEVCFNEALALGMLNYEELPANGHDWDTVSTDEATCDSPAVNHNQCTACGATDDVQVGVALGHSYDNQPELTAAPTCTESGYKYKECKNGCGTTQITGVGENPTGHNYDYEDPEYSERVEATCVTDGYITATCKVCSHVGTSEEDGISVIPADPALHYSVYDVVSNVDATCHADAYAVWACTADATCTQTKNVYAEGTQLKHEYVQSGEPVAPTCNAEGYTLFVCTLCQDPDGAANCTEGCADKRDIKAKVPHEMTTVYEETRLDSTCITPSSVEYDCGWCSGHFTYVYPTADAADAVPLKEHGNWAPTDNVVAPTCTSEGYTVYYCTMDEACEKTTNKDFTIRAQHAFTVYTDGRLVCPTCEVTYRNITTFTNDIIASSGKDGNGPLTFEDADGNKIELDWEVIGYGNPGASTAITAGQAYAQNEFSLNIAKGIIAIDVVDGMEMTIVVKESDEVSVEYTITVAQAAVGYDVTVSRLGLTYKYEGVSGKFYLDLYENATVEGITVTSNVDTTIDLYAKQ